MDYLLSSPLRGLIFSNDYQTPSPRTFQTLDYVLFFFFVILHQFLGLKTLSVCLYQKDNLHESLFPRRWKIGEIGENQSKVKYILMLVLKIEYLYNTSNLIWTQIFLGLCHKLSCKSSMKMIPYLNLLSRKKDLM